LCNASRIYRRETLAKHALRHGAAVAASDRETNEGRSWRRWTTLLSCFLHFDLSFMLWVLFGALGIALSEAAKLSPSQKGLVVAVPILAGSLLRVPVGLLVDRFGGKRIGILHLAFLFIPLALASQVTPTLPSLLGIGAMLGVAGASFAIALPLASRWFPPGRQGLAMGVAAAGNSGTVVTNLVAPRLAIAIGVGATFGVAMAALAIVLVLFAVLAREAPSPAAPSRQRTPSWRDRDLRWMCLFYAITFGGYVGLASFLPLYLRDRYALAPVDAGYITASLAFLGSCSRPIGGIISDRLGGSRVLAFLLIPIAAAYGLEAAQPALPEMVALLGVSMLCLGLGNGAVFQIVPQRFQRDIGAVTGVIGAVGGVGGFLLPTLLGSMRQYTGSFGNGFVALALFALTGAVCLRLLIGGRGRWRATALIEQQP
jgi:NNP family nitrate/nitrite transporter-like MFS transporter